VPPELPIFRLRTWRPTSPRYRSAPLRAVEVREQARFIDEGVSETAPRIVTRYEGPGDAAADVEDLRGADVIVRVELGDIRA
jgi:hypothetical protein